MPIYYNPQVGYRGDAYTFQGLQNAGQQIGAGLFDAIKHQQEKDIEQQQLQYQDQKNQIILSHAAQMKRPDGTPYVTQDDLLQYQKGSLKQRQAIAEGIAANIATDTALQNQAISNNLRRAQTFGTNMQGLVHLGQANNIMNPPTPQPLTTQPVPNVPGANLVSGGGLAHSQIVNTPGEKQLTQKEIDDYKAVGYRPIRQSDGSWIPKPDPETEIGRAILGLNTKGAKADNFEQFGKDLSAIQKVFQDSNVDGAIQEQTGKIFMDRLGKLINPPKQDATRKLSDQDQQALDWALANPNDPRAAAIKQKLGIQ